MKAKIFSLLLIAIASVLPFTLQSCSSDDEEPAIGNSYWTSKELKGRWEEIDDVGGHRYIEFNDNGVFSCDLGLGKSYRYGKYKTSTHIDPQYIDVQFPNNDDTRWTMWSIEWLTTDKTQMQIDIYRMKKVK